MKLKGSGALSENVTWPIGFALKGNVPRVNKIRGMREKRTNWCFVGDANQCSTPVAAFLPSFARSSTPISVHILIFLSCAFVL